jgi:glycosyltransferase involved in cell wall biosynthesis
VSPVDTSHPHPVSPRPPHLLHVFATFCAAGPQVRTAALVNHFGRAYRHTFVACDGRTEAAGLLADGLDHEVRPVARTHGPMGGLRAMRDLLTDVAPDLLLTYNWGSMDAVLAARSLRLRRHIHHEEGFNSDEAQRLKARRNFTRRVALRRSDVIVPSSTLERIARRTWRLPRVHFIPNGVDVARFRPDPEAREAFRRELGIPQEALVVGAVGHLRPVKNFGRLLRAAAALDRGPSDPPVHVVLVGDGAERSALEAEARRLARPGGGVHFAGHRSDLTRVYPAFDVFTLTSDSEQQPISLLEAMAAGVAVAATDVGDIKRTLPPEARGEVVPLGPGVEPALTAAYTRLLADSGLRAARGLAGRRHVEAHFSVARMADAYGALWQAALVR